MRIIHGEGYSEDVKKTYAKQIFQNVFQGIQALCNAMVNLKIKYANPAVNEPHAEIMLAIELEEVTSLDDAHASAIQSLWADKGLQEAWDRRREFQIMDSVKYYLDDLQRQFEGYKHQTRLGCSW